MMKAILSQGFVLIAGLAIGGFAGASGLLSHLDHSKPYEGQDKRQVSSLSAADIEQLRAGGGWGLAKPAEFNGYPGPKHVLEFEDKLDLAPEQKEKIEASFASMNEKARVLGEQLVEAEAGVDAVFKGGNASPEAVGESIARAEALRAQLRNVHLLAHLEVTPVLSDAQKAKYDRLRGYGEGGHSGHAGH